MDRTKRPTQSTRRVANASSVTSVLLVALLLSVSGAVLAKDEQIAERDTDLLEMGAPVTPFVFVGDLRDLPAPTQWKPGDPVKEIPRRFFPPPGMAGQYTESEQSFVDLLDQAQQAATDHTSGVFTTPSRNFAGQGYTGVNPPDTVGDVGPNYYIQAVNSGGGSEIRVWDKAEPTPNVVANFSLDSLGSGSCGSGYGDPIVLYDRQAQRWLISEFSSSGNNLCVYISQTSNPVTGGWYNYAHTAPTFPDYPKYGVWPTDTAGGQGSYVVTSNDGGPGIYMLNRGAMLSGAPSTYVRKTIPQLSGFGFQTPTPADLDGPNPPPTGVPAVIMRQRDTENHSGPAAPGDLLEMWHFDIDWNNPSAATLTQLTSIDVAEFDSALCGLTAFYCFPQPGSSTTLDPLREVIMNRLQYINHGDYETLVGNFVTDVNGADHGGVRWFELRRTGGGPWVLHQEGTYAIDADHRWMAGSAMDQSGNIALAYNVSSSTTHPSLRYTGRLSTDPLGVMTQTESVVHAGTSPNSSNRYGDYASMNLDPSDDCTFWFTGMDNTSTNWRTQIASFAFDACGCELFPEAPSASAVNNGDNRIDLSFNDSSLESVIEYRIRRSFSSGGPYETIATVADSTPGTGNGPGYVYSDFDVSGDVTYHYVVESSDGLACTSDSSNETSETATGACTLRPLFDGLTSAHTPYETTCTVELTWNPASPYCAGPVVYNVYRSETPDFEPEAANLLAFGLGGTNFTDFDALEDDMPYYYIVRAFDQDAGKDDGNMVEMVAIPQGPLTSGTWHDDAGDTEPAKMIGSSPWQINAAEGNLGAKVYKTGNYSDNLCAGLRTPDLQLGSGSVLTFSSKYEIESEWDKGEVQISTNGGASWVRVEMDYPASSSRTSDECGLPTGTYFTGTDLNYADYTADLSTWAGQVVQLRFALSTDGSVTRSGWWIDDISITSVDVPGACFPGSACPANPFVNVQPDGPMQGCEGDTQMLTAVLSGGSGPFNYQWMRDGADIPGANLSTYPANDGGEHSYNVRVRADLCENGSTDNASTQISWTDKPSFDGIQSATSAQIPICTINLDWNDAESLCPGPVTYTIYRNTASPVFPTPANRIAFGVTDTSYVDSDDLVNRGVYHYLVKAVEVSTGQADENTTEATGTASGLGGFVACTTAGAGGPPSVPTGELGTQPLRVDYFAAFNVMTVTWDATSCPANNYSLLYGNLGNVSSHTLLGSRCYLGTTGTHSWTGSPSSNLFFLIVGTNGQGIESSWGTDSALVERGGAAASGQCNAQVKETSNTCP